MSEEEDDSECASAPLVGRCVLSAGDTFSSSIWSSIEARSQSFTSKHNLILAAHLLWCFGVGVGVGGGVSGVGCGAGFLFHDRSSADDHIDHAPIRPHRRLLLPTFGEW